MIRYPELQSGFIAYPTERMVERPAAPMLSPVALVLQPKLTRTQQDFFYSAPVEELCRRALNDPFLLGNFDFHAEVFQVAGALFDRKSFFHWMRIQEEARHISSLHFEFLRDTVAAVTRGEARSMAPQQWAPMISVANDPSRKPFKASAVTEAARCRPADTLEEFLQQWIVNQGISDLILSLQVIFGRRTLPASFGAATS